jgi:hypothetical protein
MSFDAGSAVSKLDLDNSGFMRGMLQAQTVSQLFPATVTNFLANPLLGLIGIAKDASEAIAGAFTSVARAADNAGEAAEQAGVSVKFLTSVGQVAKDAGSSVDEMALSLKFLNKSAGEAAAGNATAAEAFARIGVSVRDVNGNVKDTESLFYEVADAIGSISSVSEKTDVALALLSKGGTQMLTTFNQGSAGIKAFAEQIIDLGGAIDDNTARMGDKFGKLETLFDAAVFGMKQAAAVPIMAALESHFGTATKGIAAASAYMRGAIGNVINYLIAHTPNVIGWIDRARSAYGTAAAFVQTHSAQIKTALIGVGVAIAALSLPTLLGVLGSIVGVLAAPVTIVIALGAALAYAASRAGLLAPAWAAVKSGAAQAISWIQNVAIPAIGTGLANAFTFIKPYAISFGATMSSVWSDYVRPALSAIGTAVTFVYGKFQQLASFMRGTVFPVIGKGFAAAMAYLQPVFNSIGKALVSMQPLFTAFGNVARLHAGIVIKVMGALWEAIKTVTVALYNWLGPAFERITPTLRFFGNIVGWIIEKIGAFLGWIGKAALAFQRFLGIAQDEAANTPAAAAAAAAAPDEQGSSDTGSFNAAATQAGGVARSLAELDDRGISPMLPATQSFTTKMASLNESIDRFQGQIDSARVSGAFTAAPTPTAASSTNASNGTVPLQVNVTTPKLDATDAATQVAAKLTPAMQEAARRQKQEFQAAAARAATKAGL